MWITLGLNDALIDGCLIERAQPGDVIAAIAGKDAEVEAATRAAPAKDAQADAAAGAIVAK